MMTIVKGLDLSIRSNRKDANKNTQKVLTAAYKVFAEKGYEATMEEIAAEAGVGVGTVHRRFSGKTVLAAAVVTDIFLKIKEKQLEIMKMDIPADQKMRRMFKLFATSLEKHANIYKIRLYLAEMGELGDEMRASVLSSLEGSVCDVIVQGQNEGIFREGDPKLMELLIINMINPNLILKLKEHVPIGEIPYHISEMILTGLTK
jgi:AcrR family transcriptional regulator